MEKHDLGTLNSISVYFMTTPEAHINTESVSLSTVEGVQYNLTILCFCSFCYFKRFSFGVQGAMIFTAVSMNLASRIRGPRDQSLPEGDVHQLLDMYEHHDRSARIGDVKSMYPNMKVT
jgi:hypothetical protein